MKFPGIAAALAALLCAGCSQTANGGDQMVSTQPTLASLQNRQHVLYDDGRCPAGQIARFGKNGAGSRMMRTCVERPA